MADIGLSDPGLRDCGFGELASFDLFGIEGDVGNCFYKWTVPELASWLALDKDGQTTEDWICDGFLVDSIYDNDLGLNVQPRPDDILYPCIVGASMGWSWSLFFANEAVAFKVAKTRDVAGSDTLRERAPAPLLAPGRAITDTLVDNV